MPTKQEMFVLTNAGNNNNKFWEVTLHEDGRVTSRYGRVGASGATNTLGQGEALYDRKVREKTKKGYRKIDVVGAQNATAASVSNVSAAAEEQIGKGDPVVTALVKKLAQMNRHQILEASGGQMNVDLDTGIIRTPIGVVSQTSIDGARDILPKLVPFVKSGDTDAKKYVDLLNEYLMFVPQKVAAKRGWHKDFISDKAEIQKQSALLDQLEASIEIAEREMTKARKAVSAKAPKVFDVSLREMSGPETGRIADFYMKSLNTVHSASRLRPKRFFEVSIASMTSAWEADGAKMSNIMELWHGTRSYNLLSILKSGLMIPKSNASHVTGRMFGDGLYFSDQSTKSLNYAYGYWGGGARDNNCYMFLADVGMGKHYTPPRPLQRIPAGYDSCYAVGGKSGVMNNEMIVYRTSQANLKYLIEFG